MRRRTCTGRRCSADLLVNCVVTRVPTAPFVEQADLGHERRLRRLADVTYDGAPEQGLAPLGVIAIDEL